MGSSLDYLHLAATACYRQVSLISLPLVRANLRSVFVILRRI